MGGRVGNAMGNTFGNTLRVLATTGPQHPALGTRSRAAFDRGRA